MESTPPTPITHLWLQSFNHHPQNRKRAKMFYNFLLPRLTLDNLRDMGRRFDSTSRKRKAQIRNYTLWIPLWDSSAKQACSQCFCMPLPTCLLVEHTLGQTSVYLIIWYPEELILHLAKEQDRERFFSPARPCWDIGHANLGSLDCSCRWKPWTPP